MSAFPVGFTSEMAAWTVRTLDLAAPLEVARIGGGRSNLTYLVTDATGRGVVLRRPPMGELLPSAHDMQREHRILRALAATPVPTPDVLATCDDPAVCEHPFYVMAHLDGTVVDGNEPALALAPEVRHAAGLDLARALARLHEVDIDAVGLGDLGRREGYASRQLRRWQAQWDQTRTDDSPASIDRTGDRLRAALPEEPPRPTLVHGDYNLANVILDPDGRVRGILDWELCTVGHPLADLGTLMTYWPDDDAQSMPERDPVPLLEGFADRADLVAAYAEIRPDADLSQLDYWTALASWKLAIIMQGVHRRWLDDPANGGRNPENVLAAVDRLADLAAAALDRQEQQ